MSTRNKKEDPKSSVIYKLEQMSTSNENRTAELKLEPMSTSNENRTAELTNAKQPNESD
jgi:hypothetical protein